MVKSSLVRFAVILGAIAIAGILLVQVYWFDRHMDAAEQDFHQKVSIALLNVARSIADYNNTILPPTGLIKRVSSNYYVVNFNDVIDANLLEFYLLEEFIRQGLHTNFEYGIYDCASNDMVYGNYCNVEDPEFTISTNRDLPKYDEFIYYFGVKFPSRTAFLLTDVRLAIIFSVITILALVFFCVAIFVILRQKHLSELQRDFINNMTHEFKTPISSIKVSSDVLLGNDTISGDARLRKYAEIINQQNDRLNSQVEKVLSIARLDDSKFRLNPVAIDLNEMIYEVVHSKEAELAGSASTIEMALARDLPLIQADKLHLSNVIYNLVDNAIKYSGEVASVVISTNIERGEVSMSVKDEGIGISPEYQKHLFRKFFRVPTGNVHDVKGFGLGLHYVKRIIDQHNWQIRIDSAAGRGTEMQIVF